MELRGWQSIRGWTATSQVEPTQCLPMHTTLPIGHQLTIIHKIQLGNSTLWEELTWQRTLVQWQLDGFVHYSMLLILRHWRNSICLSARNSLIFLEFCLTSFDWPLSWTEVVLGTAGYLRSLLLIHSAVPTPPIIVLFCSFPPAINGAVKTLSIRRQSPMDWSKTHSLLSLKSPTDLEQVCVQNPKQTWDPLQ